MKMDRGAKLAGVKRIRIHDNECEAERNRAESKGFHSEVGKKSGTAKKPDY